MRQKLFARVVEGDHSIAALPLEAERDQDQLFTLSTPLSTRQLRLFSEGELSQFRANDNRCSSFEPALAKKFESVLKIWPVGKLLLVNLGAFNFDLAGPFLGQTSIRERGRFPASSNPPMKTIGLNSSKPIFAARKTLYRLLIYSY